MEVFINCKFARNTNLSYENNYLNTKNEAIMLCKRNENKSEEKKSILHNSCYWICYMHGRSYIWKPIGISANLRKKNYSMVRFRTADDDEYRILIDAYKIKNQSNETVMIQAFDNTKLIGHYYEREKGAPLIVFFHGLWGHSYLDGVPIYRITQKHNWNLLLCDLRAQGDSEGKFSTLGVLEKYDCLDWVEWAQNRFGDKNPIFLMGVSMGASIVMMSSDLELPDSVYGIIDDCGFTSTLDVIKQNNNKQISKYIPKNLFPTMLNVGTKIWGSFDLSDADACKALAHTDIPLLIIHGDEDMQAPLSMAYKLYDSCNGEKQLYIVHGADHSENYRKDPGGYEKIVTKFIEERIERKGD